MLAGAPVLFGARIGPYSCGVQQRDSAIEARSQPLERLPSRRGGRRRVHLSIVTSNCVCRRICITIHGCTSKSTGARPVSCRSC